MKVHQIFLNNSYRNFNYLLEGKEFVYCIDPLDTNLLKSKITSIGKPLKAVINTHEHWDHIGGNGELVQEFGAEIWAHANASNSITGISKIIEDGESFHVEDKEIRFQATPGHTKGHMCLFTLNKEKVVESVFTGDTIFVAGVGNCHNGGDPLILYSTVSTMFDGLGGGVQVYPGHDYACNNLKFSLSVEPENMAARELLGKFNNKEIESTCFSSTLNTERRVNPFLRLDCEGIRSTLSMQDNSDKDVFLKLRELRNNW